MTGVEVTLAIPALPIVIPAKAGIQCTDLNSFVIPAKAGIQCTDLNSFVIPAKAGIQ